MAVFWANNHFRWYVWRRNVAVVPGVDLPVQQSELSLQAEQVSYELDSIRHGSTGPTRSSWLDPGCPVKVAVS